MSLYEAFPASSASQHSHWCGFWVGVKGGPFWHGWPWRWSQFLHSQFVTPTRLGCIRWSSFSLSLVGFCLMTSSIARERLLVDSLAWRSLARHFSTRTIGVFGSSGLSGSHRSGRSGEHQNALSVGPGLESPSAPLLRVWHSLHGCQQCCTNRRTRGHRGQRLRGRPRRCPLCWPIMAVGRTASKPLSPRCSPWRWSWAFLALQSISAQQPWTCEPGHHFGVPLG